MARNVRKTDATLKVLRAFLDASPRELAGSDFLNALKMFSGTLYPILDRLEEAGWTESRWEDVDPSTVKRPRRRYYKLTALGQREAFAALASRGASGLDAWRNPINVILGAFGNG